MSLRLTSNQILKNTRSIYSMGSSLGDLGAGAGKSGGAGGSIRDAGGIFGRMEAAREEEYFRKMNSEQIQRMRSEISRLQDMNEYHEQEMEWHSWVIANNKKRLAELSAKVEEIVE